MLTPEDHTQLAHLTTLPVLTMEQARYIHKCIAANSWLDQHRITWWFPVKDNGYPIEPGAKQYKHAIRAVAAGGTLPNPNSLTQQSPWTAAGISRTAWFNRQAEQSKTAHLLKGIPLERQTKEVLKLRALLVALSTTHTLAFNDLWGQVIVWLGGEVPPVPVVRSIKELLSVPESELSR